MSTASTQFAARGARDAKDSRRAKVAPLLAAGLSVRAISAETSIPVGAVHRAKRHLEKTVAQGKQQAAAVSFNFPMSYLVKQNIKGVTYDVRRLTVAVNERAVESAIGRGLLGRSERDNPVCARPGRDDRGSVAVLMCFIVLIGAALVGALVYAGANLEAASRADTYASEAARAASIAVGPVPASDGQASLQAAAAASRYLQRAGAAGSATVTGPATVRVTVTVTVESVFGTPVSATRTHTAQLQVGVTSGEGVS